MTDSMLNDSGRRHDMRPFFFGDQVRAWPSPSAAAAFARQGRRGFFSARAALLGVSNLVLSQSPSEGTAVTQPT